MSDFEDAVRRTFSAHEPEAPSAEGLVAKVHAAEVQRRTRAPWLVPLAASALTASLVVAIAIGGFGLVGAESTSAPAMTNTPTPNPSQSAIAAKCEVPPFIGAPGKGMVDFNPDVDQKLVVGTGAGQRVLLGGIDEALCQRFVEFNGRSRSALLRPVDQIGTGSDRLRPVGQGTVEVTAFQPMCATVADPQCFGGVISLGTITVAIKPRPTPEQPVSRECDLDQISLTASSEPGTAGRTLAAMVKLANGPACVLSTQVQVDVDQGDGTLVQMPENPSWQLISEQIESGKSLLVRWRWREPFCGDDFPYSVTVSLPRMGLSDTIDDVNIPGCPTNDGEPASDPRGLERAQLLWFFVSH